MQTTKEIISDWFDHGLAKDSTHMIIVYDTWDYEDFSVFVSRCSPS